MAVFDHHGYGDSKMNVKVKDETYRLAKSIYGKEFHCLLINEKAMVAMWLWLSKAMSRYAKLN